MIISIKYFAALAEYAKKLEETRNIHHSSILELFEEIKREYQFPHKLEDIRVAVNAKYVSIDTFLQEKDEVVFIPPVAGG